MSTKTDAAYGRRGGGWLPDNYQPVTTNEPCDICGRPLLLGQTSRHAVCARTIDVDDRHLVLEDLDVV